MSEQSRSPETRNLPVLTEVVEASDEAASDTDLDALIAELQTHLASRAYTLAAEIVRGALAEMEANLFEQITSRLRRELPELIDNVLREQLDPRGDE